MGHSLVMEIAEAVAESEGVDITELDYTLHDYIDADALVMLASHDTASWTLTFELPNHDITVTSDGVVLVDDERGTELNLNQYGVQ